jgi:hypothetical protein
MNFRRMMKHVQLDRAALSWACKELSGKLTCVVVVASCLGNGSAAKSIAGTVVFAVTVVGDDGVALLLGPIGVCGDGDGLCGRG